MDSVLIQALICMLWCVSSLRLVLASDIAKNNKLAEIVKITAHF